MRGPFRRAEGPLDRLRLRAAGQKYQIIDHEYDAVVVGAQVPSAVSDQPIGLDETMRGAKNRLSNVVDTEAAVDADLAVAITGFAGPREGNEEVGLIHIATAYAQGVRHKALHLGDIGRKAACEQAVAAALEMMIEVSHAFFAARTSA